MTTVEEFAAQRRTLQDEIAERMAAAVADMISTGDRGGLLSVITESWGEVYASETDAPVNDTALAAFLEDIEATLDSISQNPQPESMALSYANATINHATMTAADADEEGLVLEWVTMRDEDVRSSHRVVAGEQRPAGEPFQVGEANLLYPGQPVGPVAEWIRCRCVVRPARAEEALTAAGEHTSLVIVALPADGQDVLDQGEEQKHVTLLFSPDPGDVVRQAAQDATRAIAGKVAAPFDATVSGTARLGPDAAQVLMVESPVIEAIRSLLLDNENLREAANSEEAHPHFVPHMTLSYGEGFVPVYEYGQSIQFDRLAVWDADTQTEYPLEEVMADEDVTEDDSIDIEEDDDSIQLGESPVPFHGVLVVEGKPTGDRRQFAKGSLRTRDLPIPFTHQKESAQGHDGNVTVGSIEKIERIGDELHFSGYYMLTPEADEAIGLVAQLGRYGVSIDADDMTYEVDDSDPERPITEFSDARISAACQVSIPAFAEAYVALGPHPVLDAEGEPETTLPEYDLVPRDEFAISEKEWSGDASRFDIDQWKRSTLIDTGEGDEDSKDRYKLPIREPNGDLSRAGVHAAASRLNQTDAPDEQIASAKRKLRAAYKELGEEPPETITAGAEVEGFKRGPGWVTHPKETSRLWKYWTKGPGAAKIRWGTPNDFYRCRRLVGAKIAENSPEDLRFINNICAQWHHDAIGIWPGQHDKHSADTVTLSDQAAPTIIASAVKEETMTYRSEFFANPNLTEPTALTVTDDGRVFGHIATWGECHIGFSGECTAAPRSFSDYAYFLTGVVDTENGQQSVGALTIGTGHAPSRARAAAAVEHYDNTGSAWAYVNVGEDDIGIWFSGVTSRTATPEQIAAAKAAGSVSGDWRKFMRGGNHELVGVLTVNVPGFQIPRTRVGFANHEQVSLVAAGAVQPDGEDRVADEIADAVFARIKAREERERRAHALRSKFKTTEEEGQ